MQTDAARRLRPVLRQMQNLDRQHREYAGHEIQNDTRDQRGNHGIEQGHAALSRRKCGRRRGLDRERMRGGLAANILLQHQYAIDALRNRFGNLAAFDSDLRGLAIGPQKLRGGVFDQRIVIREERRRANGVAPQMLRAQGERDRLFIGTESRAPWRWLRQPAARRIECRIGRRPRARFRHGKREGGRRFTGDADFLADEVGDIGREIDCRTGTDVARRRDARQQDRFAFVAEARGRPDPDQRRRRPFQLAGHKARRQFPRHLRRLAGIAGISPVGVPMRLHRQLDADGKRLARDDRGGLSQQLDLDEIGRVLRPCRREREGGHAQDQGQVQYAIETM